MVYMHVYSQKLLRIQVWGRRSGRRQRQQQGCSGPTCCCWSIIHMSIHTPKKRIVYMMILAFVRGSTRLLVGYGSKEQPMSFLRIKVPPCYISLKSVQRVGSVQHKSVKSFCHIDPIHFKERYCRNLSSSVSNFVTIENWLYQNPVIYENIWFFNFKGLPQFKFRQIHPYELR